jgi:hypothetical protein
MAFGERIARAMIEGIAEQKDAVTVELIKKRKCLPCGNSGTMNIGKYQCAHLISYAAQRNHA